MFPRLILLLLPVLVVASADAQPLLGLITDRPDFTESGVVVPLGHVQAELGVTSEWANDSLLASGPELLVRWTPLNRFELRVGVPNYVTGDRTSGFGDASLGAKAQLGPVGAWDVAAIIETSVPIGEDSLSSNCFDPLVLLIAGRDIGPVSLGAQAEASWTEPGLGSGGTLVVGLGLSERVGAFLELAVSNEAEAGAVVFLHHGYTLFATPTLQFDLHGALGLTDASPEFLLGAGLSVRH
jgi:hypothetical protein